MDSPACEQMHVSQAAPQRAAPQGKSLGHLDTGALARLLAANQALVQQQARLPLVKPCHNVQ